MFIINKEEAFNIIVTQLKKNHIPFAVAGPLANAVWGIERQPNDFYIIINEINSDLENIFKQLQKNDISIEKVIHEKKASHHDFIIARFSNKVGVETIYLIQKCTDRIPSEIIDRAIEKIVLNANVPVVSPEDVIIIKMLNGSPPDVHDAQKIYRYTKDIIDETYLKKTCRQFKIKYKNLIASV